jgi:hypothetical protein
MLGLLATNAAGATGAQQASTGPSIAAGSSAASADDTGAQHEGGMSAAESTAIVPARAPSSAVAVVAAAGPGVSDDLILQLVSLACMRAEQEEGECADVPS